MKFNFQKTAKKLSVLIKRYEKEKGLSTGKKWSVLAGIWRQGMMYFQKNACHFKSSNTVFNHGHRRLKNRPTNEGHSQLSFDINFAMTWTFLSSWNSSILPLNLIISPWREISDVNSAIPGSFWWSDHPSEKCRKHFSAQDTGKISFISKN